jgi:molybdopterin synthase catalytic subunit
MEDGCLIAGLRYEMYDPMAERVLASLAHEAIEQFGVKEIRVEHSRGFVGAGERSFRLEIASAHRREALDAMDWYIDRMKRDAPIWKSAAFSTGRAALPCDTPEHTLPEVELPS